MKKITNIYGKEMLTNKTTKRVENVSLSESALISVFRNEQEEHAVQDSLKRTLRGIAQPKVEGDVLRLSIAPNKTVPLTENLKNGQRNITLVQDEKPIMIGGKVLLQVGVTSLNEQDVKEALENIV